MLKTSLLHPGILSAVARCGHHAKILIADGNYPASSKKGPAAEVIPLQLMPGVPTVAQVLEALLQTVPLDEIHTMGIDAADPYAHAGEPPAWGVYRELCRKHAPGLALGSLVKWDFYKAVQSDDHVLTIQTADQALWSNLLLVVGCRTPG